VDADPLAATGVVSNVMPAQLAVLRGAADLVVRPNQNVMVADASYPSVVRAPAVFPQTTETSVLRAYGLDGTGDDRSWEPSRAKSRKEG